MSYVHWIFCVLTLSVVHVHSTSKSPPPGWKKLDDAFWDSFFSKEVVHQLSPGTDDRLYSQMGTVSTFSYPSPFTRTAASTTFRAILSLPNYHRLVVLYRGSRDMGNGNCSALITVGDNYPLCLTGSAVNESSALQTVQHSTNDHSITFTLNFTDSTPVGTSLPGYKFYYILYNRMLPLTDMSVDSNVPVRVPTMIVSDETFPYNISRPRLYNFTDISINVLPYDYINVTLIMSDVSGISCDSVYLQVGEKTKLCGNKTQATIDVRGMLAVGAVYNYSLRLPSHSVGLLADIIGVSPTVDQMDICITNQVANTAQGAIFSPYYPFSNSRIHRDCYITINTKFQLISYNISWTNGGAGNGNCSEGSVKVNDTMICTGASSVNKTNMVVYKELNLHYQQLINEPLAGFIFEYVALDFKDMHDIGLQQITTLPFRLMSPDFPQPYANGLQRYVILNITGLTELTADFRVFDLEFAHNCERDYLQIGHTAERLCGNSWQGKKVTYNVSGFVAIIFNSSPDRPAGGFAIEFTSKQFQPSITSTTSTASATKPGTSSSSSPTPAASSSNSPKPAASSSSSPTPAASSSSSPTPAASGSSFTTPPDKTPVQKTTASTSERSAVSITPNSESKEPITVFKTTTDSSSKNGKAAAATSKGTPGYVWALVVVGVVGVCVVVLAGYIYVRRRQRHSPLFEHDGSADVGFENPVYGQRRDGEMVRLNSDSST